MSKKIAIINNKGGIAKTTTASNLSKLLADNNFKVLAIDTEPNRNMTKVFNNDIHEYTIKDILMGKKFDPNFAIYSAKVDQKIINGLFLIPATTDLSFAQDTIPTPAHWEKTLLKQIKKIENNYDYIVMDCTNLFSKLSVLAIYAADFIVIPVKYESNSLGGISDLFLYLEEIKQDQYYDYKILRVCKNSSKKTITDYIETGLKNLHDANKVFATTINQDEQINLAFLANQTVTTFSPNSRGAQDYKKFTQEIKELNFEQKI